MLRGIQKRMIVCKPPSGSRFESAYFVLREKEGGAPDEDKEVLMREVRRILAEGDAKRRGVSDGTRTAHPIRIGLLCFFGGLCCGLLPPLLILILS